MTKRQATAPDVRDKDVLVYSMGIEGRDLARWLTARGARVTMSDTRTDRALRDAGAVRPDGVARVVTGEPLLDPEGFDVVAVSQSILRHDPAVRRAHDLEIPVISQAQLFLRLCPGRVVGITGSSGKSTTTALVGQMAEQDGLDCIVGGNIGTPLLERLEEIGPGTTVVFEISHTQLQYTDTSPEVAAITNVTPNHLDQFSWDEYVDLKRNILRHQTAECIAILNRDDPVSMELVGDTPGDVRYVSAAGAIPSAARVERGRIILDDGQGIRELFDRRAVRLRGEHNLANVVMACGIASAIGIDDRTIASAATGFAGIAHRLEVIGRAGGVLWVNDSIATTPERTAAGLRSFDEPVVLLLGGREKHLPMEGLAREAAARCRAVVCFGEAAGTFAAALKPSLTTVTCGTLAEAVEEAAAAARDGDVVLLSPGGTSFDAYPGFEARGAEFRRLVSALPGFEPATEAA